MPYLPLYDPATFQQPTPPGVTPSPDEDEEERLARLRRVLPTPIQVNENAPMSGPTPGAVPMVSAPLPSLAQDRLARPAPPPPSLGQQAARDITSTIQPSSITVGPPIEDRETAPVIAPGRPVTVASPMAPVSRLPVSVRDEVGPMPDRGAEKYQYTGHGPIGRIKAGFSNIVNAPPVQTGGGSPGMVAGEALGGLLGRFIGGVARPQAPGEYKYQKDLTLWQTRQEAASRAATEETQRAHALAQATHRDPYTGEVDPYYQAMINQKGALTSHYAAQDAAATTRAQALLGRLDESSRRDLFNALAKGTLKPTPELQQKLSVMGLEYVTPVAKGQLGMLHHRGVDSYGRPIDTYYTWDRATGFVRPMRVGDETIGANPDTGGVVLPPGSFGSETPGTPKAGVTVRPGETGGQPFTLEGVPPKGAAGPLGDFVSSQQALGRLAGHRANWESTFKAWQREKAQDAHLQQQERDLAAQAPDEYSPARAGWEAKKRQLATEREKQRGQIDKYEDQLSKIEAEVHSKYDELGGGTFIKWRGGEPHSGWEHNPKALEWGGGYPMPGGERTRQTGRIPGYKPLRPGLLNPTQGHP